MWYFAWILAILNARWSENEKACLASANQAAHDDQPD